MAGIYANLGFYAHRNGSKNTFHPLYMYFVLNISHLVHSAEHYTFKFPRSSDENSNFILYLF